MAALCENAKALICQEKQSSMTCILPSRQLLLVVSIIIALSRCILGHTVNENLYMDILYPEEIRYIYKLRPARTFGGVFNSMLHNVYLIPADPGDGCGELLNSNIIQNNVVLIQRGQCSFLSKTITAERAGAIATVIYDSDETNDWSFIDMIDDGSDRTANIPAVFLLGRDGQNIKQTLRYRHLQGALINLPVNVTGIPLGKLHMAPWSLW